MLSETDIIDRHKQALGEAHRACQRLGRNADPDYMAPRGHDYSNLRRALQALEGSCRQMAHFRADARWIKLGVVYAKAMRTAQAKFVGQRWAYFNELTKLFELGQRSMEDLQSRKTGRLGAILPSQPTDWLVLPDLRIPRPHHFRSVH